MIITSAVVEAPETNGPDAAASEISVVRGRIYGSARLVVNSRDCGTKTPGADGATFPKPFHNLAGAKDGRDVVDADASNQ